MKKSIIATLITLCCLLVFLVVTEGSVAGNLKWIRVGNLWDKVIDSSDQGYGPGPYTFGAYYYNNFADPWQVWDYRRMALACRNWTDENGVTHEYKMTGYAAWSDEQSELMPVPDESGATIKRIFRYAPPSIKVDGRNIEDPFPMWGDEVAPEKITGTADVMVTSKVRTSMGVDIDQKVLAWSQAGHDDYMIYDFTFTNTGNIDLDDEVELPNQTLTGFYFNRSAAMGWKGHMNSYYGARTSDSLRVLYTYPDWAGGDIDTWGESNQDEGFFGSPWWQGWAILHADRSGSDHSDDPAQPRMTGYYDSEAQFMRKPAYELSDQQQIQLYTMMEQGLAAAPGVVGDHPLMEDADLYPNTVHEVPMDVQGATIGNPYAYSWTGAPSWVTYIPIGIYSIGPYDLAPGESVRIVWAHVMGSISPKKAWEIGQEWKNENLSLADAPEVEMPPIAQLIYDEWGYDENDQAKDKWLATGRDSMFTSANAAQWAVDNNYQVPVPPPAPSVEISSRPDGVIVEWGTESEAAADLAGYRVYRAVGSPYYSEANNRTIGDWEMIYEAAKGTQSYTDTDAQRGFNYYYYVAAFDDGTHPECNLPGGVSGVAKSLESGRWLNYTRTDLGAARLKREPGAKLDDIRIVPNPYNAESWKQGQHFNEQRKIMFFNLPPVCTITIYTETGDLVKTLEHTDGSGDEEWVDPTGTRYMGTDSSQIPVSGIYIAHVETPDGQSVNKFLVIVR